MAIEKEVLVGEVEQILPDSIETINRRFNIGRTFGRLALLSTVFIASGVGGAFVSPAKTTFGPHKAEVRPILSNNVELDFGALGSIIEPVKWPGDIGAHIDLQEIPISSGDNLDKADFTEEDINNYARLFADYNTDADKARLKVIKHSLKFGALGDGVVLGLFFLLGKKRREELTQEAKQILSNKTVAVAVAGGLLLAPFAIDSQATNASDKAVRVNSVFDGTTLQGASIEGRLLQVIINKYGAQILERIDENNAFYDKVLTNLKAEAENSEILQTDKNSDILLYYTDLHCNVGMAEVIGKLSHVYNASILASGGDETISGLEIEGKCVQVLSDHVNDASEVGVTGNHDSNKTGEQLQKAGFTVLNGNVVKVDGLHFLGDADPRRSDFGQPIRQNRAETAEAMGQRLADIACADPEGVDVLIVHDPKAAQETMANGCAKIALNGHLHVEHTSVHDAPNKQQVLDINGASAGGAKNGSTTLGPLQNEARVYAIKIDKTTHQPIQYQIISVDTNSMVTFHRPVYVHRTDDTIAHQYSSGPLNVR